MVNGNQRDYRHLLHHILKANGNLRMTTVILPREANIHHLQLGANIPHLQPGANIHHSTIQEASGNLQWEMNMTKIIHLQVILKVGKLGSTLLDIYIHIIINSCNTILHYFRKMETKNRDRRWAIPTTNTYKRYIIS